MTPKETDVDYLRYYDAERFLFGEVGPRFRATGRIAPEEFFLILIWKANRAKFKHRDRLTEIEVCSFPEAVTRICDALAATKTPPGKLRALMERWRFRLPTATAILSVLQPENFTVYDYRVCEQLKRLGCAEDFRKLKYLSAGSVWPGYERFMRTIEQTVPLKGSLRDKDRYLWGKSLYEEILRDVGSKD